MSYQILTPAEEVAPRTENLPAMRLRLSDIVAEYDRKLEDIPQAVTRFEAAGAALTQAATLGGTFGMTNIDAGRADAWRLKESLLKSAWKHVYDGLNIEYVATAQDKKRFTQGLEKPAPFTLDTLRATFGGYLLDPKGNILRGLAEVFSNLDPAFKSHDRVKIGVAGLPKRVVISYCNSTYSHGENQVRDILNALAAYQQKPLTDYREINALFKDETALMAERQGENGETLPARGVRLRRFANGNGHLFFEPDALRDINRALAEYYGDVLADCSEEKPTGFKPGTAVSKDLQYYPTPAAVVERVLGDIHIRPGDKVLEPSCGCGRFLDALREAGADCYGVEVDSGRAAIARAKGHSVLVANFLETLPTPSYDRILMNPPFYGRHYAKHVTHALKFLKPGGTLTAILPITARYDHGLLSGQWHDLPVGSFSESGTNINTTVLTIRKPD